VVLGHLREGTLAHGFDLDGTTLDGSAPEWFFFRACSWKSHMLALLLRSIALWAAMMSPLACACDMYGPRAWLFPETVRWTDYLAGVAYGVGAVGVRFRTGIWDDVAQGEHVSSWTVCAKTLLSGTFWADVLSLATLCVVPDGGEGAWRRFLPLAALFRLWRLSPGNIALHSIPGASSHYLSALWLVCCIFLVSHLYACLWLLTIDLSGSLPSTTWADSGLLSIYTHSLFSGAGTLCGIGAPTPENDVEKFVLAILFPTSATLSAVLLARIVVVTSMITIVSNRHHEHMAYIESAASQLGVEPQLRRKIVAYHHFLQRHHNPEWYEVLLNPLPQQLLRDLKTELFRHFIKEASLLRNLDIDRVVELIFAFEEFIYCPGDIIVRHGDPGESMFFIIKGSCDILSESHVHLAVKNKGDYFGEICLLFPNQVRRTAHVRARTFCVVAMLTQAKFDRIVGEDSPMRSLMRQRIHNFSNVSLPSVPLRSATAVMMDSHPAEASGISCLTRSCLAPRERASCQCSSSVPPSPELWSEREVMQELKFVSLSDEQAGVAASGVPLSPGTKPRTPAGSPAGKPRTPSGSPAGKPRTPSGSPAGKPPTPSAGSPSSVVTPSPANQMSLAVRRRLHASAWQQRDEAMEDRWRRLVQQGEELLVAMGAPTDDLEMQAADESPGSISRPCDLNNLLDVSSSGGEVGCWPWQKLPPAVHEVSVV